MDCRDLHGAEERRFRLSSPFRSKSLQSSLCTAFNLFYPCSKSCTHFAHDFLVLSTSSDRMGRRPDGMERWGLVDISKEAARLLYHHFRLFLPFFLAFVLPAFILGAFLSVFLPAPSPELRNTIFSPASGPTQGRDWSLLLSTTNFTFSLLCVALSMLYSASSAYIVAYIHSNVDAESDDESITKRVFKLLPHAFLRIFVTQLWTLLVVFIPVIPCTILFLITLFILIWTGSAMAHPNVVAFMSTAVIFIITLGFTMSFNIVFLFAQSIAVLEPGKYGRAALKQSTMYARRRAGTIISILLSGSISGDLLSAFRNLMFGNAELPNGVKIIVAIFVSTVTAVVTAFVGLMGVVTYFVCKSSFEAVYPEFQRGSNISSVENPYEPIEHGNIHI